jgi:hypothetical protein
MISRPIPAAAALLCTLSAPAQAQSSAITIDPTVGTTNQGLVINQTLPSSGVATGPLLLNSITATNPGTSTTGGGLNWDAFGQIQNQINALRVNFATSAANGTNNGAFSVANFVTAPAESYGAATGVTIDGNASGHDAWGFIGYATVWPGATVGPLIGMEAEVGISNGGSATYRIGVGSNTQGPVQGSVLDAAFMASSGGVTVPGSLPGALATPWQHLMALVTNIFGAAGSPITPTGDFFFSESPVTVAHFANLPNVTVTGNILDFPNMALYGNGSASFGVRGLLIPPGTIYSSCASCGNAQVFGAANGASGADGMTMQDSAGTNIMFSGVAEAGNTFTRFGQVTGNWGELVTLGSTNAGLMIGTLTSAPLIMGTNNTERVRVTSGGLFNIGPAVAPDTLLTVNGNSGASAAPGFGVAQLHLIGQDGQIGGAYADVFSAQGLYANRHAGGTLASRTASAGLTTTISFSAQHWDTSVYSASASMDMGTINTQSLTDHSGFWRVRTVATGSTILTERMRVQQGLTLGNSTSDPGIGLIYLNNASFLMRNLTSWTNGAAAAAGTLTNAPAAGNPTKWIPIDDNGTTRYIPAW